MGPIGQKHIGKGASVLILAECLMKRDFLSEGEIRGGLLRSLTEGLAFLWAVDAVETDAFGVVVVQDFEGVAVEDGYNGACEVSG